MSIPVSKCSHQLLPSMTRLQSAKTLKYVLLIPHGLSLVHKFYDPEDSQWFCMEEVFRTYFQLLRSPQGGSEPLDRFSFWCDEMNCIWQKGGERGLEPEEPLMVLEVLELAGYLASKGLWCWSGLRKASSGIPFYSSVSQGLNIQTKLASNSDSQRSSPVLWLKTCVTNLGILF